MANDYCIIIDNGETERCIEAGADETRAMTAWQGFVDRGLYFRVTLVELDVIDGTRLDTIADWEHV